MSQKKLQIDDERDKHPFYSDYGVRQWKKRLKDLMKEEETWSKRKRGKEEPDDSTTTGDIDNPNTTGDTSVYAGETIQSVDKPKKRRRK